MHKRLRMLAYAPAIALGVAATIALGKLARIDSKASRNRGWPDRK